MTTSTAVDEPVTGTTGEEPQGDNGAAEGKPEQSNDSAPSENETSGKPSLLTDDPDGKTGQATDAGSESGEAAGEQTVEYDLALPEGATAGDDYVDSVKEFAAANKLSQEAAQAVIDRDVSQSQATQSAWNDAVGVMHDDLVKDKDLGGENLASTKRHVLAALEGHSDLKAELVKTGFENHPGLVRLLAQFGKAKSEPDGVSRGDTGVQRDSGPDLRTLWPNSPEMWGEDGKEY